MKSKLFFLLILIVGSIQSTVYTTIGVDTWDANGEPPAGWISGHTINVNHSITNMTAYTLSMNGTITVNINSGGIWEIGGIVHNLTTSVVNVNDGGRLEITVGITWTNNTLNVAAGALVRTNGSTTFSTGTVDIDGLVFIDGSFTNAVTIAGTGCVRYTGSLSNTGSFPGGCITLPVELTKFEGKVIDDGVLLEWSTGSEIRSDFFNVMRSNDGVNFKKIGDIPAMGHSETLQEYEFIDARQFNERVYYQLVEQDFDGELHEYKVISVVSNTSKDMLVEVYPNPTEDRVNATYFSKDGGVYIFDLINMEGQVVYNAIAPSVVGRNTFAISMLLLEPGQYSIRMFSPNGETVNSIRIVKK